MSRSTTKYEPSQHVVKARGARRLLHPVARRGAVGPMNLLAGSAAGIPAVAVTVFVIAMLVMEMGVKGYPLVLIAPVVAFLTTTLAVATALTLSEVDEIDKKALEFFRGNAEDVIKEYHRLSVRIKASVTGSEHASADELGEAMLKIISDDSKDEARSGLRRRTVTRLAAVQRAFIESKQRLGTAPKDEIEKVLCGAVLSISQEAIAERIEILRAEDERYQRDAGNAIEDMRAAVSGAINLGTPYQHRQILPINGTGRARIDRMVTKAEEALSINPDLVDSNGARVDAAIREHLPRLLSKHAEVARHGRMEDLAQADSDLETGVELIRRSVEEGLRGLVHEKADDLRTEIAFLKLRRGEGDESLRLPG